MDLHETFWVIFGGIFSVLALASLIGWVLKARRSPQAPPSGH
jgi:hypothetical protein